MENSRFLELQEAFSARLKAWDRYEKDTHKFIFQFRNALIEHLDASSREVELVRFEEPDDDLPDNFVKRDLTGHKWLDRDAFWHFRFRLQFHGGFTQWTLKVRPQGSDFLVVNEAKLRPVSPRELLVSPPDFSELVEHFYTAVRLYLQRDFHEILGPSGEAAKPSIGFEIEKAA